MNFKIAILGVTVLFLSSCKTQSIDNNSLNTKTTTTEHFNIKNYDTLQINPDFKSTVSDRYYVSEDKVIRIISDEQTIQVEEKEINTPFTLVKIFSGKTNQLIQSGRLFDHFPIGTWLEYSENGNQIRETNCDKNYKFSLEELIYKMKAEYNIDILNKERLFSVRRYLANENVKSPFYEVIYRTHAGGETLDCFLFDGNSGALLFRTMQSAGDKNGTLHDQYLKSLQNKK